MGLEDLTGTGKHIGDLVNTNPDGSTDTVSTLDNHIRGIKNVLLNCFAGITGAVTATHTELNYLAGLTAGTAAASKALVLDASRHITNLVQVTATTFIGNLTGNVTGNVSGGSGSCTGNALSATSAAKWTTARTLTISGNASGIASVDGSSNIDVSIGLLNGSVVFGQEIAAVSTVTVQGPGSWAIPAGAYFIWAGSGTVNCTIDVYINSAWRTILTARQGDNPAGMCIVSDGTNFKTTGTVFAMKVF